MLHFLVQPSSYQPRDSFESSGCALPAGIKNTAFKCNEF